MQSIDTIVVLDYGSQTAQLIARRLREIGVYSELFSWDAPQDHVMAHKPKGIVLSGGPASVYDENAPTLPRYVTESGLPILGICYGMQLLAHTLGGKVAASASREYGPAQVHISGDARLWADLPGDLAVWMSHGDRIEAPPAGFVTLASSDNSPIAAMGDTDRRVYGIQFHPEVSHTLQGSDLLRNFATGICGCELNWTPENMMEQITAQVCDQIQDQHVLLALSGGCRFVGGGRAAAPRHRRPAGQRIYRSRAAAQGGG